ncbi:MAG: GNAT family N-acetyltransferase [Legionella sp.]|jgi:GNAT superfamily N-acetyltransferase
MFNSNGFFSTSNYEVADIKECFPNAKPNSISDRVEYLPPSMPLIKKIGPFKKQGFEILQDSGREKTKDFGKEYIEFKCYAFVNGKAVGDAFFRVWKDENYISLIHIEVLEKERKKGYATKMIQHVAEYARAHNKGIWINANHDNDKFYTNTVKSLFHFPNFVYPKADGWGYHSFLIPNDVVQTLNSNELRTPISSL